MGKDGLCGGIAVSRDDWQRHGVEPISKVTSRRLEAGKQICECQKGKCVTTLF